MLSATISYGLHGLGADPSTTLALQHALNWLSAWIYRERHVPIAEDGTLSPATFERLRDALEYASTEIQLPYVAERWLDLGAPASYPFKDQDLIAITNALTGLIALIQQRHPGGFAGSLGKHGRHFAGDLYGGGRRSSFAGTFVVRRK